VVGFIPIGRGAHGLAISRNTPDLYVANRFESTVSVVEACTGRLLHTIVVGSSPHGLTYFPQPGAHSLGHNGVYR
jgi:YVTN family beta-propeller protein